MKITALVMAGGRGTRLKSHIEKPLVIIGKKTLLERVIDVLKKSREINNIIVAISRNTPQTAKKINELSVKSIITSGEGYISDIREAIQKLNLEFVITISADLPFLTVETIDRIIRYFKVCEKPTLAVMVPAERYQNLGLSTDLILNEKGRLLVPAGINILDGKKIRVEKFEKELDQELLLIDSEEFANINTSQDLEIIEKLFLSRIQ